jgi:excisionase family DNA binding protein
MMDMETNNNSEKYFRVDGVSKYLKVSKSLIYKMVSRNDIPFCKIGSRIIFKKDDLDKWIDEKTETNFIKTELPKLPKFKEYGNL